MLLGVDGDTASDVGHRPEGVLLWAVTDQESDVLLAKIIYYKPIIIICR